LPGAAGVTDGGVDAPTDTGGADSPDAAPGKEVVYANAGTSLYVFDFNASDGTLTLKPALTSVLALVPQYAVMGSPAQKYLYAGVTIEPKDYIDSFSIDPASGGLNLIAPPAGDGGAADAGADAPAAQGVVSPNGRAIYVSLSKDNKYLLAVHNVTKSYTVFNLGTDGTVGAPVPQAGGSDMNVGNFVHQIRVDPTGQYVFICDRGTDPTMTTSADGGVVSVPEGLGHLRSFTFANGVLTPLQTITYPAGYGPRHLDFHPTQPWVYVSVGRGNQLITYSMANGMLTQIDAKTSLSSDAEAAKFPTYAQDSVNGQQACGIMVHPSGKWLWISNTNRQVVPYTPDAGAGDAGGDAGDAAPPATQQVYIGTGENNVALFSINQTTGIPTFVAAADSHGFVPRTFALDPSGRFLIAANQKQVNKLVGSTVTPVLPNLSVFSVAADGNLTYLKTTDLSTGDIFWVGGRSVTGP
jgi:6-phosphogluconolactonase (cycloisomerase 2 family)